MTSHVKIPQGHVFVAQNTTHLQPTRPYRMKAKTSLLHKTLRFFLMLVLSSLMLIFWNATYAATDTYLFDSEEKAQIFKELASELRCPQCQNNNIAESNATISIDMRDKVYELLQQNYSKQEVVDFMVERYGNFITYNPPVTPATLILWLAPFLAILIGLFFLWKHTKKTPANAALIAINTVCTDTDLQDVDSRTLAPQATDSLEEAAPFETPIRLPLKQTLSLWIFAAFLLIGVTSTTFLLTGNWPQIQYHQQAQDALFTLKIRALDANDSLTPQEMLQLAVGLRNELARAPETPNDWMLLGHIYLKLRATGEALQAFSRAYAYKPHDNFIKSVYGQMLLTTNDPLENSLGEQLLWEVLKETTDVKAIASLAFYAYTNQRYEQAIALWEQLLAILPPDNASVPAILRTLEQTRAEYEKPR